MRLMPDASFTARTMPPRHPSAAPPLLVLLHGIGADENDLLPLVAHLDARLLAVSLRAPRPYAVGYSWFPIEFRPDGSVIPDVEAARATLGELARWLAAAPARLGTDPTRTFVLGFSQGAMMSLGLLVTVPERLAGVLALSGRFAPAVFDTTAADDAIARVPLLVAHGLYDEVLPIAHGRGVRDAFAGRSADLTYRELPIGHEISAAEVALIRDWLSGRLDRRAPP